MPRSPVIAALLLFAGIATSQESDPRYGPAKKYQGYFPWTPPASKESWDRRQQDVREQVLIANGLWPMPQKHPLKPVIHGKVERPGYTVEKVYFASFPGHYVTGNLYRPTAAKGKSPGVLCPHGHWPNGRFFEATEKAAQDQIKQGAEERIEGAKYPLQARCAQLARMGCVVFHYDMVGYADSTTLKHRDGFNDAEADLWLQSPMGLQTFNSIRALDFLLGLPEVDAKRIGVTGASGGGSQTFILCGIDPRPTVAFPAVMVSTDMQGGCVCENCSYLRVGTGNIELAALFAPKPLGMVGADDWTKEIETKGLPELKQLYKMLGVPDLVSAKTYGQFKHNYNQISRELMYEWFNKHLGLGQKSPIKEKPFEPIAPKDLAVFGGDHPTPKDFAGIEGVRRYMQAESERQLASLLPKDAKGLAEFRSVLGPALRVLMGGAMPSPQDLVSSNEKQDKKDGVEVISGSLSRKSDGARVVGQVVVKEGGGDAGMVIWVHPDGIGDIWTPEGKLTPPARKIVDGNARLLVLNAFRTGPKAKEKEPVIPSYGGYHFGYNRPLVSQRVQDILAVVSWAHEFQMGNAPVHLVGVGEAGPWVALARGLCGDKVAKTAADLNGFRFEQLASNQSPMMLPGALKYGGLPTLTALSAPHPLLLYNANGTGSWSHLTAAYKAAGAEKNLQRVDEGMSSERVAEWILAK